MQKNKIKVGAYCRVSTDKDDQMNSLENQKIYFTEYIKNHEGWELVEVYFDEGISGTQTKKRSGFNNMIQDAESGNLDLILTKEVARFARNTVDTLSYTRKLKNAGVGVIFTIDNIDTRDSDGELRLTIMASIAQEESRKTSERVKWGQKRRMEQGVVFGRDLLGYTVQNGILAINEEEAPVVRAIFHKYTNEGKGTHVIARELLEEGMRPKRMTLWSNTVILRALRNEKYVGDLCQKKTITPDFLTHAKKYNHGEEAVVYLKDHHEPIIDRDLWDRTQAELERRSKLTEEQKSKHSNRYWCSGKLRCAECGSYFVSRTKKFKGGGTYKAWRCHASAIYGSSKKEYCMGYCINLIQTEHDTLKKEILNEISRLKKESGKKTEPAKIQKKIDNAELKKRRAIDAMLEGILTKEDFQKQTEWYDEELKQLNQQLADAQAENRVQAREANNMEQYIKALDEIMLFDEHNETLYQEILDHIDIHTGSSHTGKVLDFWLKGLPVGIRLKVRTSGRCEHYNIEIMETSFIPQ